MYYFSNSTDMSFDDAVASTRDALKRHHFAILAEIDLGKVLRRQLAVDFGPYVIISACSPQLVPQTIEADNQIGSILLCNLVVQQHRDGRVEISVADPAATIGTINNVELISAARKLRFMVQQVIDSISSARGPDGSCATAKKPAISQHPRWHSRRPECPEQIRSTRGIGQCEDEISYGDFQRKRQSMKVDPEITMVCLENVCFRESWPGRLAILLRATEI